MGDHHGRFEHVARERTGRHWLVVERDRHGVLTVSRRRELHFEAQQTNLIDHVRHDARIVVDCDALRNDNVD